MPYYVLAQLAGSALGPILGRLVWGSPVARTPVVYAALRPAAGWTFWDLFPVEAATVALIVLVVGLFSSVPRLARAVPYVVGFLVGAAIAGLGTITGGSDESREAIWACDCEAAYSIPMRRA
jgi:glycerol uptake facilitator-like aquaporin